MRVGDAKWNAYDTTGRPEQYGAVDGSTSGNVNRKIGEDLRRFRWRILPQSSVQRVRCPWSFVTRSFTGFESRDMRTLAHAKARLSKRLPVSRRITRDEERAPRA